MWIRKCLLPVNNSTFKPIKPQQPQVERSCISKKGKKLQERILINENNEDEDNELVGETTFAEYPWMIELLKRNPKTRNFEYKCGAVLINPTTALTANHCLKNKIPSNYLIRAGEWDRSSTLEYLQHQDRSLSQIISHPQYYSGGLFNDIAILKWIHPLNLDLNIQPICLPEENQIIKEGTKCIVSAWGKTSENTPTTDKLKFVKVPIVEHNKCQSQLQSYRLGNRFKLHESFICAGGDEGLDSCQNDGGSPLICKHGNDDSYFLTGLVSWGLDCGIKNVPGVYTSIPNLMRWIKTQITEK
ncbi:hypothetical protein PVAND_013831 [Polypedilum vanderplanki]|uniref:Phenoloxidase-activating factor 2 n=1 Tax=Polypedilum vanderplanki TaxID=319348 RepID=A0A9J6CSH8_POLVA|nr:hypothetical protein PVAND_013831 [Polypedilum vanderplanki]